MKIGRSEVADEKQKPTAPGAPARSQTNGNIMDRDVDQGNRKELERPATDDGAQPTERNRVAVPFARDRLAAKICTTDGVTMEQAVQQIEAFEQQVEALDEIDRVGAPMDSTLP